MRFNFFTQEEVQSTIWERVEIEDEYKGYVIGKRQANLRKISGQTGAKFNVNDGEVYIIRGNKEQRKLAKVHIRTVVVSQCYYTLFLRLHDFLNCFVFLFGNHLAN